MRLCNLSTVMGLCNLVTDLIKRARICKLYLKKCIIVKVKDRVDVFLNNIQDGKECFMQFLIQKPVFLLVFLLTQNKANDLCLSNCNRLDFCNNRWKFIAQ